MHISFVIAAINEKVGAEAMSFSIFEGSDAVLIILVDSYPEPFKLLFLDKNSSTWLRLP